MQYAPEIEAYIQAQSADIAEQLQQLRMLVHSLVPEVTEKISYQMPTFYLQGNLLHFAVFKNHIGIYPGPSGVAHVQAQLAAAGYKWAKGSIQLPLTQTLPLPLLSEIIIFRAEEQRKKA